jgi:hypothetical protein
MTPWVIVGGGPHGVHLAARLIGQAGVPVQDVRVYDDAPSLLARWDVGAFNTGMRHLRSPGVHHLDVDPFSLLQFAGGRRARTDLASPYDRPSVELFRRHCELVIERCGLRGAHVQARVIGAAPHGRGVRLETTSGAVDAERVILAVGPSDRPHWPDWAADLPRGPRIAHVLGGTPISDAGDGRVVVVGGGISAAQLAVRLGRRDRPVTMLMRHPIRTHTFDSDPGWLGPLNMKRFVGERCPDQRRALISAARHRGSIPEDVGKALQAAVADGRVRRVQAAVLGVDDGACLRVETDAGVFEAEWLLLATGFERGIPGGTLTASMVRAGLPVASCGFPVPDAHLRWHPRVFVTGALAELEVGPVSRNIAGARRAADRIVSYVTGRPRPAVPVLATA